MIYIPDISHHHPVTNWDKVDGNSLFLITKATEGTSYVDPTLKNFIAECEKRHISYWLYTFLRKGNELAQTKFMVETCKPLVGDKFMGYILDIESGNKEDDCVTALNWLRLQCKRQMIYTMYSQRSNYNKLINGRGDTCAWWEARYGKNDGLYNAAYPCHDGVDLHQFTSAGDVPGLSGKIDLNKIVGKKDLKWFTEFKKPVETLRIDDIVSVQIDQIKIMNGSGKDKVLVGWLHKGARVKILKLNSSGTMAKVADHVWLYTKHLKKV